MTTELAAQKNTVGRLKLKKAGRGGVSQAVIDEAVKKQKELQTACTKAEKVAKSTESMNEGTKRALTRATDVLEGIRE